MKSVLIFMVGLMTLTVPGSMAENPEDPSDPLGQMPSPSPEAVIYAIECLVERSRAEGGPNITAVVDYGEVGTYQVYQYDFETNTAILRVPVVPTHLDPVAEILYFVGGTIRDVREIVGPTSNIIPDIGISPPLQPSYLFVSASLQQMAECISESQFP